MGAMNRFAIVVLGVLGVASVPSVGASELMLTPYVGAQYGHINFKRGNLSHVNQNHINARVGVDVIELFGLEARVGAGFTEVEKSGSRVKSRYQYGVYGVVNLPTGAAVSPYVIGGYTHTATGINGSKVRDDSAAYGLGINWHVSSAVAVTGEFMRLVDNDWSRQSATSFGVKYSF